MFRGNHPTRVDEKGRLKVPAEFKRVIDEKYGTQFYITSLDGKIAQVYPFEEWERIEQKLAGLSTFNPTKKKFLDRVNYWGQQVEMDGQGRLLMPQLLRDSAQIKGEVAVTGNLTHLLIRNLEQYRKEIEEQSFTPEDEKTLADLGVSSLQFADPARGFSFQAEGPLDMRMDPQSELTAEQVVNHFDERELADVIYEFGEERRSRRIARAIVRSRPILTTAQLAVVISAAARPMKLGQHKYDRIHPATRTFQAVRIFVNRELYDLRALLEVAPQVLKPGGRLVVISFHSLEDRIVKDAMREGAKQGQYRLLTKKPVTPSEEEIDRNPRARSAKLRAAERV